jgi:hypothetical protein
MHTDDVQRKLDALVSRYRGTQASPTAAPLELEAERLRLQAEQNRPKLRVV